jgi:hypothetical protein
MSGDKVFDYSGQSNHGTITGVTAQGLTSGWQADAHGGALCFDYSNDYVALASAIAAGPAMTYIVWLRSTATGDRPLLGASGSTTYIGFFYGNSGSIYCGYPGGQVNWQYSSTLSLALRMFALTKSGSTLELYHNGESLGLKTLTGLTDVARIGFGQSTPFSGLIFSVLIYNRALTVGEIASLYAAPYCMFESLLWPLGSGAAPPTPPSGFTPRIAMIM